MAESQPAYNYIPLDTFCESLRSFPKNDRIKIKNKCKDVICNNPYHGKMLIGKIEIKGLKFAGLRHMKVGVKGVKGGAYILYRVCEECKKNGYAVKSGVRCKFCNGKNKHVVLFVAHIRSYGY